VNIPPNRATIRIKTPSPVRSEKKISRSNSSVRRLIVLELASLIVLELASSIVLELAVVTIALSLSIVLTVPSSVALTAVHSSGGDQ